MKIKKIKINGKSVEELNNTEEIKQRIRDLENLVQKDLDTITKLRFKKILNALKKKLYILENRNLYILFCLI